MDFQSFVYWAFLAIIPGGIILLYQVLTKIYETLFQLNEKIAMILEKTASHEKELSRFENRIQALEQKP